MGELKVSLNGGIGDVLLSKNILDTIKNNYNKIYISPNKHILDIYRKNESNKYHNFILDFMNLVFNDDKYVIEDNKDYQRFSLLDNLTSGLNLNKQSIFTISDFSYICGNHDLSYLPEKYVVITTKVRGNPSQNKYKKDYEEIFINTIKNISKKIPIVLLGEKNIPNMYEYRVIGSNHIYCIYDNLIKNINNIIDLTIYDEQIKIPSIKKIKEDCSIMNNATSVITLGFGGNLILALSTSKNNINFPVEGDTKAKDHTSNFYETMTRYPQRNSIKIHSKFNNFIKSIKEIV